MSSTRRSFLKLGAGFGAMSLLPLGASAAPACRPTPTQTEGPFYPIDRQIDEDADLTFVSGRHGRAKGQVVYVHGVVTGSDCRPVAGALVEIWQACVSGRYNHPSDPNTAPLDPDFQYWGKAVTDSQGRYTFKTIVPGAYPAGPGWIRPPHIHFKVARVGYHELTTQMYFAGQALNQRDRILLEINPDERDSVIVNFDPAPEREGYQPQTYRGLFPITLQNVR